MVNMKTDLRMKIIIMKLRIQGVNRALQDKEIV